MTSQILKTFTTKNGEEIILRTPIPEDVDELLRYANEISAEDTYTLMSGEIIAHEEQERYMQQILTEVEKGDRFQIFAFSQNKLVANADIHRLTRFRKRSLHVVELSISVSKEYRGLGIGKLLLETLINTAKKMEFRILILDAFSENSRAISLYQKMGFKTVGEIPEAIFYKNKYMGRVYMYLPLT